MQIFPTCTAGLAASLLFVVASTTTKAAENETCPQALDFTLEPLASEQKINLCQAYKGKVVMVVNTASFCGFTPQYKSLEKLYGEYKDQGFVILGFPSNDFGQQDPGSEESIKAFCDRTYSVKFPMFEKSRVTQANADPLFRTLGEMAGEYPQWNFHKYLLDRNGQLVASIPSRVDPASPSVLAMIKKLL